MLMSAVFAKRINDSFSSLGYRQYLPVGELSN